jgi:hypothetical protein
MHFPSFARTLLATAGFEVHISGKRKHVLLSRCDSFPSASAKIPHPKSSIFSSQLPNATPWKNPTSLLLTTL